MSFGGVNATGCPGYQRPETVVALAAWNWTFDEAVDIALDGVEATWLDDSGKRTLSARIRAEANRLRPAITPG